MRPPSADDRTYVPADERSFCAVCGLELAMIRVSRTVLRLGHLKQPATLHAPRLAPVPRPAQEPALVGSRTGGGSSALGRTGERAGEEQPDAAGPEPSLPDRTDVVPDVEPPVAATRHSAEARSKLTPLAPSSPLRVGEPSDTAGSGV